MMALIGLTATTQFGAQAFVVPSQHHAGSVHHHHIIILRPSSLDTKRTFDGIGCGGGGGGGGRGGMTRKSSSLTRRKMKKLEDVFATATDRQLPSKLVIDAVVQISQGNHDKYGSRRGRSRSRTTTTSTKIIASDVAVEAGVSLSQARKDLALLASISRGGIAVSEDGELMYTFPQQLVDILAQNSRRYKTQQAWDKAWPVVFHGIRVSFGTLLLVSVGLSVATLAAMSAASDSDDRRGGNSGIRVGYYLSDPALWDLYRYRRYHGYYGDLENGKQRHPNDMRFFDSVFSYVFGDGNPNFDLEQKRLLRAARVIRDNGGAVIAEQLAPFLDVPEMLNDDDESFYVDESFVLPIVSQLGGEPIVTDDGDIVYVFEELTLSALPGTIDESDLPASNAGSYGTTSLARSSLEDAMEQFYSAADEAMPDTSVYSGKLVKIAQILQHQNPTFWVEWEKTLAKERIEGTDKTRIELMIPEQPERFKMKHEQKELEKEAEQARKRLLRNPEEDMTLLLEREHRLSVAPSDKVVTAAGFGVLNLGVVLAARQVLSKSAGRLPGVAVLFDALSPFLLAYGLFYNVVPAGRKGWNAVRNYRIRRRNNARELWKQRFASGSDVVDRKLRAAAKLRTDHKLLNDDQIVYDTNQPIETLQEARDERDFDEFDALLTSGVDQDKDVESAMVEAAIFFEDKETAPDNMLTTESNVTDSSESNQMVADSTLQVLNEDQWNDMYPPLRSNRVCVDGEDVPLEDHDPLVEDSSA